MREHFVVRQLRDGSGRLEMPRARAEGRPARRRSGIEGIGEKTQHTAGARRGEMHEPGVRHDAEYAH